MKKPEMTPYIGVKLLRASEPMTKSDYCKYRGWELPKGEDPNEMVRLVEYAPNPSSTPNHENHKGYVSMSPQHVFDDSYVNTASSKEAALSELIERKFDGKEISDGYHTRGELYDFRKMYNAALFNEFADKGIYDVHKSVRHEDGEPCFGGGWFIVVAILPTGQISNHYKMEDWGLFNLPVVDKAKYEFDGHTPEDVLDRLEHLATHAVSKVGGLTFGEATEAMNKGLKVAVPEWGGYWFKEAGMVKVMTAEGELLETPHFQQYIFRNDWKIVK